MSTLDIDKKKETARAIGLVVGNIDFTVSLTDGRRIIVPYSCYPRLEKANVKQRAHFEVCADGRLLHWPDIDEDIEVQHIIDGRMPIKNNSILMAVAEDTVEYK
jgi:hypothetical protein